jgi:protein-tyrosine phosphatase
MIIDCNEIIQGKLWVGTYVRPGDVRILQQMGFTATVNLQSDWDLASYNISFKQLLEAFAQASIDLRRIPIPDFDRHILGIHLPLAVEELEEVLAPPSSKAYLHCTAGINRSPTLAAAYLIKAEGLTSQDAYDYVIAKRSCSPYIDILQEYEAYLKRNADV